MNKAQANADPLFNDNGRRTKTFNCAGALMNRIILRGEKNEKKKSEKAKLTEELCLLNGKFPHRFA